MSYQIFQGFIRLSLIGFIVLFGKFHLKAQVTADFTANTTSGCSPVSVNFQDQSSGNVTSYLWDFGNGNTSTKKNPSAIYTQPGTYTVELTVNNGQSQETKTDFITIYANPQADISVSSNGGCAPKTINFSDASQEGSGPIQKWTWDLGDGTIVNQQNPTHQYQNKGSYDVSLVVEDVNGCTDNITKSSLIDITQTPTADFTSNDSISCEAPLQVQFSEKAQSSTNTLSYQWDFGDGGTSTQPNPTHNYQNNGIYDVSLKVTDAAGCKDSIIKKNYAIVDQEEAEFSISDNSGCVPHQVSLSNLSSPNIPGSNYEWNFGDGNQSQAKNPTHQYQKAGTYDVQLKVTFEDCEDSLVKQNAIEVYPEPDIKFSTVDTISCKAPFEVNFSTSGDKNIIQNWNWEFGDGNTGNASDPTYTFNSTGNFSVSLKATDTAGCQTEIEKSNYIQINPPLANFERNEEGGCVPLDVKFTDKSEAVDGITSFDWDFADGNSSNQENPQHTFNQKGAFKVRLAITTSGGCIDSTKKLVEVGKKTNPDFKVDKRKGCIEKMQGVKFTSLTNDAPPIADSFNWDFEKSGSSKKENPLHDFDYVSTNAENDSLDVELVSFQNKCPDTIRKKDFLTIEAPWADFTDSTVACKEDSVIFKNLSSGYDSVRWDFGDGANSSKANPVHQYSSPGFYDVKLIVWNFSTNCKDTAEKTIGVSSPYSATFSIDNPEGCIPHEVTFTGSSSDSSNFQWDFGNGKTSQKESETITYTKPDTYDVKFIAESKRNGCKIKVDKKKAVIVNGAQVDVNANPVEGCTPLEVNALGNITSNSGIAESYWEFGNGDNWNFDGDPISYTYEEPPNDQQSGYFLSLIVKDQAGCYDTGRVNVKPYEPRTNITFQSEPFCDSVKYRFQQQELDNIGLGPFNYQWDLKPGSSFNQKSIERLFSKDEQVEISLTLEDQEGCTNTDLLNFDFEARDLTAGFTADTTYAECPPLEVNFKDTSKAGYTPIAKWQWNFGDESQSQNKDPQKLYLLPDNYSVELVVEDTIGCTDTFTAPDYIVLDGPRGSYSLSPLSGCSPLDVKFEAQTERASKIEWDLGDGNVRNGAALTHTYDRATQYIPLLILSDSSGCTYSLPPKDTIDVDPSPNAGFVAENFCFNYPTQFTDTSKAPESSLEGQHWEFEGGQTSSDSNASYTYQKPGYHEVKHAVKNGFGCWDTVSKVFDIGGLEVFFDASDTGACQSRPLQFFDKTFADTTINSRQWSFGDGDSSQIKNPTKTYDTTGYFDVELAVSDVEGCSDTLTKERYISVGDTLPPEVPEIYRASVEASESISLVFGEYEDFDIKRYQIYRKRDDRSNYQMIDQIIGKKDTQFMDNNVDPIHHSYCYKIQVVSFCDRKSDLDSSTAHCTIELTAKPDTNRVLLHWSPYKGWDSISSYIVQRERLYQEGQFFAIDTVPEGQTSLIDSGIACYKRHNYKIKAIEEGGATQFSISDTSGARPVYIPDVPSNEIRRATVEANENVKIEWSDPPTVVENYQIARSLNGESYRMIDDEISADTLTFIDQNTQVQNESYYYKVRVKDTCGDIGNYSNIGRSILLETTVNENNRPVLSWTPYQKWEKGVDYYDIELKREDGSFRVVDQVKGDELSYVDQNSNLNQLPQYIYRITAHERGNNDSTTFSVSNESEVEGASSLFVSNAFTPDGDGINDEFTPRGLFIDEFHMEIFNRWGALIYETDEMSEGWDGTHEGRNCQMDAYIYIIRAIGIDGEHHNKKGNVTLLR